MIHLDGRCQGPQALIPELAGKLDGFAMRVPTRTSSVVDLVVFSSKQDLEEEVNAALKKASEAGPLKGYLAYEENELVSRRLQGQSTLLDRGRAMTLVVGGTCVKVISWYDNEWGYSCRVRDLINLPGLQGTVIGTGRTGSGRGLSFPWRARSPPPQPSSLPPWGWDTLFEDQPCPSSRFVIFL